MTDLVDLEAPDPLYASMGVLMVRPEHVDTMLDLESGIVSVTIRQYPVALTLQIDGADPLERLETLRMIGREISGKATSEITRIMNERARDALDGAA